MFLMSYDVWPRIASNMSHNYNKILYLDMDIIFHWKI
jgi:hypothetical protein